MFKVLMMVSLFVVSANASASVFDTLAHQQQQMVGNALRAGLNWKVGDTNNYNLDMGFIKGTMSMTVASYDAEGIWMHQDMDLGFAGKQQVQTLLDPNTGEVKKVIANGQEQEIPKQDLELIEATSETITVPAGTFDCTRVRLQDKTNNGEVNIWAAAGIPLSGMAKTIQPSQLGQVTIVLTSFTKM